MSTVQGKKIQLLVDGYCKLYFHIALYFVIKHLIYLHSKDTDWFINDINIIEWFYNGSVNRDLK